MADPVETDDQDQAPPPKKDWRKELEDRATSAEQALVEATTSLAIHEAGLGHLTDEQRDDVLTLAKAKGTTDKDGLLAIAERLSLTKPPEPTTQQGQEQTVAQEQDPAVNADLTQLAAFAAANAGQDGPRAAPTGIDLSAAEYDDNQKLQEYLNSIVPDNFGPTTKF
jgi:hypothetical protein